MIILLLLLVSFGVLHSVLADLRVKEWFKNKLGGAFRLYRLGYNLLFLVMLGAIIYVLVYKQQLVYVFEPVNAVRFLALALVFAGAIGMGLAFAQFDMGEFIGFSYLTEKKPKPEKLRIGGLYRYVRHPLYFAIFILFAGFFLLQPTQMNLVAVGFMYLYIYIGARLEEKKLVQIFGDDYLNYQKKVKMLIPFIF